MSTYKNRILRQAKNYFNISQDLENEKLTINSITRGISFKGINLWILIFAIFIASLGLNVNSTAVIIGAMLISPLMGPIIGMGLAVGINDLKLLNSAFKNYAVATCISILTATIYFLLSPFDEAQSELLARTSPTIYDIFIAFCGGAAGIIAIASRDKGNVIPGVAIATALMPPLCTAGYGIAVGNIYYFLGAFYLYFINTVFICSATFCGVRLMKFHRKELPPKLALKSHRYIMSIIVLTMIPALFLTYNLVTDSILRRSVKTYAKEELCWHGTQIISQETDADKNLLNFAVIGREVSQQEISLAANKLERYGLSDYSLNIIQGVQTDSIMRLNNKLADLSSMDKNYSAKIEHQSQTIKTLEDKLLQYTKYEQISDNLNSEVKILFPNVKSIYLACAKNIESDTLPNCYLNFAVIELTADLKNQKLDVEKLKKWLEERTKTDDIKIITTYGYK